MDVMIDIETLSTRMGAQIVQIGAVAFEAKDRGRLYNNRGFKRFVKVQDGAGTIDHGTLVFWMEEIAKNPDHPLVNGLKNEAVTLNEALYDLVLWPETIATGLTWAQINTVWAKPPNFDLSILTSAFATLGMEAPWDHRATRCARTLFAAKGGEPKIDWTGLVNHDALDDAIGQAMQVQKAMAE